jgi:hypothetical protein
MNRFHLGLPLSLLLVLAACGGDDSAASQTPADSRAADGAVAPRAANASAGEGTLRLGDAVHQFAVRACDVSGETDDMYQTLSGRGTTADGEQFDVFASRQEAGDMLVHTVSFQSGAAHRGEGIILEAQRMRHGDAWMSVRGGAAEPLIRIDGDRVTASGLFGDPEMSGEAVPGELYATCR